MFEDLAEDDVRGFDVAVDDPGRVEGIEPRAEPARQRDRVLDAQRAGLPEPVVERPAFDVTDSEVVAAVGLARLEDRHEVLVLNLGRRPRLLLETLLEDVVVGEGELEQLESHDLAVVVRRPEDEAHPALAQERFELVAAEAVARLKLARRVRVQIRHSEQHTIPARQAPLLPG